MKNLQKYPRKLNSTIAFLKQELVSSAFALLFTEISATHTTEISVKSGAKAEETN